jgi:hypothetical protein
MIVNRILMPGAVRRPREEQRKGEWDALESWSGPKP